MVNRGVSPSRTMMPVIKVASTASVCLALLMMCAGCSRWAQLTEVPPSADGFSRTLQAQDRVPAVLETVHITQNGARLNPSPDLERRVLGRLHEAQVFSYLIHQHQPNAQPQVEEHVNVRLSVTETVDPHAGENALKGIVIGASMFLLTSLLPFEYDYASQMVLEIERWDGQTRRYVASSSGTAYFHLFGATPLAAIELKGTVTTACLNSLMNQLVGDVGFYAARQVPTAIPTLDSKTL